MRKPFIAYIMAVISGIEVICNVTQCNDVHEY